MQPPGDRNWQLIHPNIPLTQQATIFAYIYFYRKMKNEWVVSAKLGQIFILNRVSSFQNNFLFFLSF
jgi:hypothetical protein